MEEKVTMEPVVAQEKVTVFKQGSMVKFRLPNGKDHWFGLPCIGKVLSSRRKGGDVIYYIDTECPGISTFGIVASDVELMNVSC